MIDESGRNASDAVVISARRLEALPPCKIALYGFGAQPVVFRHLIELAAEKKLPLSWCAILPMPYHRSVISGVLPASEILDVFQALPRVPVGGDSACLEHYTGSLAEDLAAQKRPRRKRHGRWLLDRGIDYYRLYKEFLADRGATHLLMPLVETPEAKIAVAVARELGIGVIVPVDLRNMTGTYFARDSHETPPVYAEADAKGRTQASEFVRRFRSAPAPARAVPAELGPIVQDTLLKDYRPPLWQRARLFASNAIERPDIFDLEQVRITVMRNVPLFRKIVRGVRGWRNASQYDIAGVEALPERFIYYPLQFSPEASINTPAPFFLDQMRAIDALRFAMPSNYVLVVKEHPACINMRPVKFMRRLRNLPGVVVIKTSVSSVELIKRAGLTATITGTAALEAFLLGCPAMALGPGLSAWAIGRVATVESLRKQIRRGIDEPFSDDFVIDQIAKLMRARYAFYFETPGLPGEPVLRLRNVQRFLSALLDHLQRERSSQVKPREEKGRSIA